MYLYYVLSFEHSHVKMPSKKKGRGAKKHRKDPQAPRDDAQECSSIGKICNGCDQPPHPGKDLLNCNRCKNAWYHDEKCQRDHFPKHKSQCRKVSVDDVPSRGEETKKCLHGG